MKLIFVTVFWLAIVAIVPVILWHMFLVIREYRDKKRSQSDAGNQGREDLGSAERRVDALLAERRGHVKSLSPALVSAIAVSAAVLGIVVGWFGARSWDLPEVRLARSFEEIGRAHV